MRNQPATALSVFIAGLLSAIVLLLVVRHFERSDDLTQAYMQGFEEGRHAAEVDIETAYGIKPHR